MRNSYNRPDMTWAIASSSSDADFVTDSSALTNGRPADATRVQAGTTSSPSLTDTIILTATFGNAIKCGCAALLMPNIATALPAGVKVTFAGELLGSDVALNGNSTTQRTYALPNGAPAVHCVFPAVQIDTLIITIYNDKSGATWITSDAYFDLGEVWAGECADFAVANDIDADLMGGLLQRKSHNNQAWPLAVQAYRSITVNLVPMTETVAIGPNPAQDDFQTVANALSGSSATVLIPFYLDRESGAFGKPPPVIDSTTINSQRLARSFILGNPDQPVKMKANGDKYFVAPITFGETPP